MCVWCASSWLGISCDLSVCVDGNPDTNGFMDRLVRHKRRCGCNDAADFEANHSLILITWLPAYLQ